MQKSTLEDKILIVDYGGNLKKPSSSPKIMLFSVGAQEESPHNPDFSKTILKGSGMEKPIFKYHISCDFKVKMS